LGVVPLGLRKTQQGKNCGKGTGTPVELLAAPNAQAQLNLLVMVKIKEGYVFSAKEKAEFDRENALPRKASGKVDYYFKPQTKYPPRIYVFMHAEIWQKRNHRPMGLHNAVPFLSRPMHSEEIEYHHFDNRLCYHQYEDWDKLIYAEEQEAEYLDKKNPGTGTEFLNRLKSFREKYPLAPKVGALPPVPPEPPVSEEMRYFRELTAIGDMLAAADISGLLDAEQSGEKRPLILNLLRKYYKNIILPAAERITPDEEKLKRKVWLAQERSRKNFVRRVNHRNPLFALAEIHSRYPDYTPEMLIADLIIKNKKTKRKKHKPIVDLRRCQLEKLAARLRSGALSELEYHHTCNRMVMLQNAHQQRLPIPLIIKLAGETLVYSFAWRTRENVVKSLRNSPTGKT
jgi:hypothetical protein